jgi:hypothetical protein
MQRLNKAQLRELKSRHPHNNKTTFFDRVSSIILPRNRRLSEESTNFLQGITKLSIICNIRLTNG